MNRKVLYARLQTNAYLPGAGELGSVFPSQTKTLDNLNMSVSALGLEISFSYRGLNKNALVPLANVVLMDVVPEEKPVIKK